MSSPAVQGKLQKSLARFKERIEKGSYYEAQQTIKSITNRYVFSKNFEAAIELLYQSSMILMEFKRFDEASDLLLCMVEIFETENRPLDEFKKHYLNKIIELLTALPDSDANLLSLSKEVGKFASKKVGSEVGFPSLNLVLGEKLYYSGSADLVNISEHYLFLSGTDSSRKLLVNLEYSSYLKDDASSFGLYACRLSLPYLLLSNIKFAIESLKELAERLKKGDRSSNFNFVPEGSHEFLEISTNDDLNDSCKLWNFLQLLVELIKRSSPENGTNFKVLTSRYKQVLESYELLPKVNSLGIMYFNVSIIQKPNNMLQDMMSGLLGGGSR